MQLTPRYLVKNRTTLIADMAGFVTEYRPVYTRQLKVYRGIDNVLEFQLLNADQKTITTLADYRINFQAFDENKSLIIEHTGVIVNASKGLFKVTVTDNDLLNVKQQYLSYNIHLVKLSDSEPVLTYSDTSFNSNGTIFVSSEAFPGPRATHSISTFIEDGYTSGQFNSSALTAEPGINGNEALHTAVIYTDGYIGDVIVQATLDDQAADGTDWADITTVTFSGSETEPTPVNFNGVFNFVRFRSTADPANKISKILVRN